MVKQKLRLNESKGILKESAFLYVSIHIFILLKFLTGFLVARFLGPSIYGLRSLFGIVVEFEFFSHLGTFDAARREVPFFRGKNDPTRAKLILDNVFGINLFYSLVICGLMIATAFYLRRINYDRLYIDFVLFMGLFTITEKIKGFYFVKMTVDKKANLFSKVKIVEGISYTLSCILLTYFFGLRGLFVGLLLTSIIVIIFIYLNIREIPAIRLSPRVLWGLLKIGFPIMLISLMFILLRSVDRIIIANMLTKQMLGYFAIGTITSGLIYFTILEVVKVVFAPRILEKLGETADLNQIKNYFLEPTIIIAYFSPLLVGALFLGIHVPIKYFLPEYMPAISVVKILSLGAFFISIVSMPLLVGVVLNKQVKIVFLMLIAILSDAILSYLFIAKGWGINGVAIGTSISYFILSFICMWYALKQFHVGLAEYVNNLALIYAPFIYLVFLVYALDNLLVYNLNSLWSDLLYTAIKVSVFFILFSAIFLLVRKHPAVKKLIDSLPFTVPKIQATI